MKGVFSFGLLKASKYGLAKVHKRILPLIENSKNIINLMNPLSKWTNFLR
jgi:hypothetical protein